MGYADKSSGFTVVLDFMDDVVSSRRVWSARAWAVEVKSRGAIQLFEAIRRCHGGDAAQARTPSGLARCTRYSETEASCIITNG